MKYDTWTGYARGPSFSDVFTSFLGISADKLRVPYSEGSKKCIIWADNIVREILNKEEISKWEAIYFNREFSSTPQAWEDFFGKWMVSNAEEMCNSGSKGTLLYGEYVAFLVRLHLPRKLLFWFTFTETSTGRKTVRRTNAPHYASSRFSYDKATLLYLKMIVETWEDKHLPCCKFLMESTSNDVFTGIRFDFTELNRELDEELVILSVQLQRWAALIPNFNSQCFKWRGVKKLVKMDPCTEILKDKWPNFLTFDQRLRNPPKANSKWKNNPSLWNAKLLHECWNLETPDESKHHVYHSTIQTLHSLTKMAEKLRTGARDALRGAVFCEDPAKETNKRKRKKPSFWSNILPQKSEDIFPREWDEAFDFAIQRYMTCFLPMCTWFVERLSSGLSVTDDVVPLRLLYPWPERSMDWTSSPDVSRFVQHVKFWKETTGIPLAVVSILQKALPYRSQGRSIAKKIKECCLKNPCVMAWMKHVFRCNVTGTFSNSSPMPTYRPNFEVLLQYYVSFFDERYTESLSPPREGNKHATRIWSSYDSNVAILDYLKKESKLCIFFLRGYLLQLLSSMPQYFEIDAIDWKNLSEKTSLLTSVYRFHATNIFNKHLESSKSYNLHHQHVLFPFCSEHPQIQLGNLGKLFPKQTIKPFPRESFATRLLRHFKYHVENLIIAAIETEETYRDMENALENLEKEPLEVRSKLSKMKDMEECLKNDPDDETLYRAAIAAINRRKEFAQLCLEEPSDEDKQKTWEYVLGLDDGAISDDEFFSFLSKEDIVILYKLMDAYDQNISPKEVEHLIPRFKISVFKRLHFLLQCMVMASYVQLAPIGASSTLEIQRAMTVTRYKLLPMEVLPEKAYHVYITICCHRIASFEKNVFGYGQKFVILDAKRGLYACGKKKIKRNFLTKHDDKSYLTMIEEDIAHSEGKQKKKRKEKKAFSFKSLNEKAKRKWARKIKRLTWQDCTKHPPVLTIDVKGYRLIYGKTEKTKQSHVHCNWCGNFHRFDDGNWWGNTYACTHCWLSQTVCTSKCSYCWSFQHKTEVKYSPKKDEDLVMDPKEDDVTDSSWLMGDHIATTYKSMSFAKKNRSDVVLGLCGQLERRVLSIALPGDPILDHEEDRTGGYRLLSFCRDHHPSKIFDHNSKWNSFRFVFGKMNVLWIESHWENVANRKKELKPLSDANKRIINQKIARDRLKQNKR